MLAAVASYLQSLANRGKWLLRIEDIDPPREQDGADKLIIDTLALYGFDWDGPVIYQSQSTATHESYVTRLLERNLAYPCSCSRRDLADAPQGPLGTRYPGTCRSGCNAAEVAIRVLTDDTPVDFNDALQGPHEQRLEPESGDFVIKRRDGLIAYHLAVVADDYEQGITQVVRGIDLLDSTPRQIHLQRLLGFSTPSYLHIPVVINLDGQKLSKLSGATGIPLDEPAPVLARALAVLRQPVTPDICRMSIDEIWRYATAHWDPAPLLGIKSVPEPTDAMAAGQNGLR